MQNKLTTTALQIWKKVFVKPIFNIQLISEDPSKDNRKSLDESIGLVSLPVEAGKRTKLDAFFICCIF